MRNFGFLFAVLSLLATIFLVWKGSSAWPWCAGAAGFFLVTGLAAYPVLRPVYVGWMTFAFVLGWVNTRLILGLFFYLILTPVGLIMRLLGRDPMQRKLEKDAATYWVTRSGEERSRARYENLF